MKPLEHKIGEWLDELSEARCLVAIFAILSAAAVVCLLRREWNKDAPPPPPLSPRAYLNSDGTLKFDPPLTIPPGGRLRFEIRGDEFRVIDSDGNEIPIETGEPI